MLLESSTYVQNPRHCHKTCQLLARMRRCIRVILSTRAQLTSYSRPRPAPEALGVVASSKVEGSTYIACTSRERTSRARHVEILDSTWEVGTSSSHWKLLKAFGSPTPAGLSHNSSFSTSSGLPTRLSSFGVQSPTGPPHTLKAVESAVRVDASISACSSSTEGHGAVVEADASSDAGKSSDELTDTTVLPESPLSSEVLCKGNGTEDSQCG